MLLIAAWNSIHHVHSLAIVGVVYYSMLFICSLPDLSPAKVVLSWLVTDGVAVKICHFILRPSMSSILSSCEITGTLGLITLGDATVLGTLSDGTVIAPLGGATVGTSLGTTFALCLFGFTVLNSVAYL